MQISAVSRYLPCSVGEAVSRAPSVELASVERR